MTNNLKIVTEFMQEHFGEWLGKKLLTNKLVEYGQTDLNNFSDFELKMFVDSLMKTLFSKIRTQDQVKSIKFLLFESLFGKDESIKLTTQDQNKKIESPLEFLNHVFGPIMGRMILNSAMKSFEEMNIKREDELKQILFMKKIINQIFGFNQKLLKKIDLDMLVFIKRGEAEENILKSMMEKPNYENLSQKAMENAIGMIKEQSPEVLEKILAIIRESYSSKHAIWIEKIIRGELNHNKKSSNIEKRKIGSQRLKIDILNFFKQYVGEAEGERFLNIIKLKYRFENIEDINADTRDSIIEDFKITSIVNQYSPQRQSFIISKFKRLFD